MLGIPIRYLLKHPIAGLADLSAHPRQVWATVEDYYAADHERQRPECRYEPDETWERRFHESIGASWPCEAIAEFWDLWPKIIRDLENQGIRPGPESFQRWNDGDAGFVRAIWCLVRHLRPKVIVETGVGHGVTSRCILEAIAKNGEGHLWSIDLPPIERHLRQHVGMAVPARCSGNWTLIKGSSRLHLPKLLSQLGEVDLFIHDSLHTERNVRFELDLTWTSLKQGGAIVVDDIDANWGFRSFTQALSEHPIMVCEAEPIRPDLRRFNDRGLFGIILKRQTVTH